MDASGRITTNVVETNPNFEAERKRAVWRAGRIWRHDMRALIDFFETPHPSLDGKTPDAVIEHGQGGIERVMKLLDEIEAELRC